MSSQVKSNKEIPPTMPAIAIVEPGGPEVLQATRCDTPRPGSHEVLIAVEAAGVNRPDCLQRQGLYPLPPDASPLPGLEVAGEVVACGDQVTRWRLGDRVVALTHGGGYAAFCVAPEGHCLSWPVGLSRFEAAALPETCFTVQSNLFGRADLKAGETVLIHGGSSGIGSTAIQLARIVGARVLTTAGSEEKCAFCRDLGAELAVNYKTEDWEAVVFAHTADRGVDVVLDMVAGPYVNKNIKLLASDGRYAMIAFLLGPKAEVNFAPVLTKRLTITASTLRPQSVEQKSAICASVERSVWPHVLSGKFKSPIFKTFPWKHASDAHLLMEQSGHMGKIVLDFLDT